MPNQKGFAPIVLILGILLISSGVLYGYIISKITSEKPNVSEQKPTVSLTTPNPTSADRTVNWKTYSDNDFNYSFKFPEDKFTNPNSRKNSKDTSTSTTIKFCPNRDYVDCDKRYNFFQVRAEKNTDNLKLGDFLNRYKSPENLISGCLSEDKRTKYSNLKFLDQEAFVVDTVIDADYHENMCDIRLFGFSGNYKGIFIQKDSLIYSISLTWDSDNVKEELDQILSTFKFLDRGQAKLTNVCPSMEPRRLGVKQKNTKISSGHLKNRFNVQFTEGTGIRLRDGKLISINGNDLTELDKILNKYKFEIERLYHSQSEEELDNKRLDLEAKSCKQLGDLNLAYVFNVPEQQDNEGFINELNGLSIIEVANPISVVANP